MKYRIKTGKDSLYEVEKRGTDLFVDGVKIQADVIQPDEHRLHIILEGKSYSVTLSTFNTEEQTYSLIINGKLVESSVEDPLKELLKAIHSGKRVSMTELTAPMPGLVREVKVKPGDVVKKGEGIMVLEAMKMENVLKTTGEGVVKEIMVTNGQAVEKGQRLVTFS